MSDTRYSEAGRPQSESLCICSTDKCIYRPSDWRTETCAGRVRRGSLLVNRKFVSASTWGTRWDRRTDGRTDIDRTVALQLRYGHSCGVIRRTSTSSAMVSAKDRLSYATSLWSNKQLVTENTELNGHGNGRSRAHLFKISLSPTMARAHRSTR